MNIDPLLSVLVLVIIGTALGWVAALVMGRRQFERDKRSVMRDRFGGVTAIGERIRGEAVTLEGRGTQTSKTVELDAGMHRAEYQFPDDVLIHVRLVDTDTGDDETLFIKSGGGVAAFHVEEYGRFQLVVEPADERARWRLTIQPFAR